MTQPTISFQYPSNYNPKLDLTSYPGKLIVHNQDHLVLRFFNTYSQQTKTNYTNQKTLNFLTETDWIKLSKCETHKHHTNQTIQTHVSKSLITIPNQYPYE